MSHPLLEARNVWLEYPGSRPAPVLRGVDLTIEVGDFVGIRGPSGSGKSSLLWVLAGLRRATRGRVHFQGAPWAFPLGLGAGRRRASVGFVFQEPFLVPHWTVAENIAVQQPIPDRGRIERLASKLAIRPLLDQFPDQLSSGERQRASVARALVNDPALVLADEPTSSLDTENGIEVTKLLTASLARTALLVCTHDPRMLSGASRIYRMEDGTLRRID